MRAAFTEIAAHCQDAIESYDGRKGFARAHHGFSRIFSLARFGWSKLQTTDYKQCSSDILALLKK